MVNYISDRISYSKKGEELTIVISGKVEKWQETLLTIWLTAWTCCGGYVLYSILGDFNRDEKLVMFIYLVFWLYFEVKLAYAFAWRKWGAEVIKIGSDKMTIKMDIKKYGKLRSFFLENVSDLKKNELPEKSFAKVMGNSFWNMTEKTIGFEYFSKPIVLGIQLSDKDATKVVKLISAHLRKMA